APPRFSCGRSTVGPMIRPETHDHAVCKRSRTGRSIAARQSSSPPSARAGLARSRQRAFEASGGGVGRRSLVSPLAHPGLHGKRSDRAVELAVRWFLQGSLPMVDVLLGLDDDAVGISAISPEVPPGSAKKVAAVAASLRAAVAAPSGPEAAG